MSVNVTNQINLAISETLDTGAKVTAGITDTVTNLASGTTPAVTKQAGGLRALSDGEDTIDLTAVVNQAGGAVNFTGLAVQAVAIQIVTATAEVTFAAAGSNGYHLFAASAGKVGLKQGEVLQMRFSNSRPAVDSTHKAIAVASSDVDATYRILLTAGAIPS